MSAANIRWRILMVSLILTVVAIIIPVESTTDVSRLSTRRPASLEGQSDKTPTRNTDEVAVEELDDPFAPRAWVYTPEPVKTESILSPVAQLESKEVVESIPPLPYRFLGKFNDGTELVVYLGRGEQTVVAKNGETLDGTYKIVDITEKNIDFVYLPRDEKQTLVIE